MLAIQLVTGIHRRPQRYLLVAVVIVALLLLQRHHTHPDEAYGAPIIPSWFHRTTSTDAAPSSTSTAADAATTAPSTSGNNESDDKSTDKQEASPEEQSTYFNWTTRPFFPPTRGADKNKHVDLCANFPVHLLSRVQVVLKTGSGERARTEAQLDTMTSCINNILIVSDRGDTVHDRPVVDIFADLPPSYFVGEKDLEPYLDLTGKPVVSGRQGWLLDRFKFLPMVERAFVENPVADWFVFIESDTYFFWDTLLRLLSQLDPAEHHYLGAPAPGSYGRFFAHGGAGFVLSAGLVRSFVSARTVGEFGEYTEPAPTEKYEDWVRADCCGDAVLAYALVDKLGVRLKSLWPIFNGAEVAFLRVDKENWCVPLMAMHRASVTDLNNVWKWERTRSWDAQPLHHSTFLTYTHAFLLSDDDKSAATIKSRWDNHSPDLHPPDMEAHSSLTACGHACSASLTCLQYSYTPGKKECRLSDGVSLGHPVKEGEEDVISGWELEKLRKLGFGKEGGGCVQTKWVKPLVR